MPSRTAHPERQGRAPPLALAALLLGAAALPGAGCGGQARDEVAVTYRAGFRAEPGVGTTVDYPFPSDAVGEAVRPGLVVSEGGTAEVLNGADGLFLRLSGRGEVTARFTAPAVKGGGEEGGTPRVALSQQVPGQGTEARYFRVNKGGASTADVEFEYTASRACGLGCGGQRSWKFSGAVSIGGPQPTMTEYEER